MAEEAPLPSFVATSQPVESYEPPAKESLCDAEPVAEACAQLTQEFFKGDTLCCLITSLQYLNLENTPSSSALAIAPGHGTEVVTPRDAGTLAGSVVPDASALPAGSSTTPILVEDKERAADSMPLPPARKEIVLTLRAPSIVPVAQPKGRKRKFTKGGDGESSQQGDSSIASGLRGKFMSLIDGKISECGSETSRLAGELLELQGRWSETEAMLTAVKDSHSVKVLKFEVAIGELERDLGKTASSLLKEKKTRKAKSSEVRRLQSQIEGDAGLASRGIREAKDALRSEFQARFGEDLRLSGLPRVHSEQGFSLGDD
ncbi:hypothetical protein F2Q70_00036323 [Brassica cretica]|uniref:Uncharacterized protein n=1 Tax=Brassica cretica TaxID=69181 RepID=A0A8S9JUR9_BRACR|nr:hypothetical protein F2Q70_00036323 [Brassica cretica]